MNCNERRSTGIELLATGTFAQVVPQSRAFYTLEGADIGQLLPSLISLGQLEAAFDRIWNLIGEDETLRSHLRFLDRQVTWLFALVDEPIAQRQFLRLLESEQRPNFHPLVYLFRDDTDTSSFVDRLLKIIEVVKRTGNLVYMTFVSRCAEKTACRQEEIAEAMLLLQKSLSAGEVREMASATLIRMGKIAKLA